MPKNSFSDAARVAILKSAIESAIAELRDLAVDPVDIRCGQQLSFQVWPSSDGDRISVYRDGWGGTSVKYTDEGLIIDVHADGDCDLVHTASVFKVDLQAAEDEVAYLKSLDTPGHAQTEAVQHG